jgi:hypothetical protein
MNTARIERSSTPSAEYRFFIFDALDGEFVYFRSPEDRDAAREDIIQLYLDDGWSEEVEQVVAGEVTHTCEKVGVVHRPEAVELDAEGCDSEGTYWGEDYTYRCNYDLLPLVPEVVA